MDAMFDGTHVVQHEIAPGQNFTYTLKFPDAGMYWYHPHVREDFQQELGLYGNYLVEPADSNYWSPVNREVPLFLDDILIENGKILLSKDSADRTLMGRFGNVMLVNGETNYSLSVHKGEVVRFYITNSANVRPFNISINGARMKLVGSDGSAYENDRFVDSVLVNPSERAIVEVLFPSSGTFQVLHTTPEKRYVLGTVSVSPESATVSRIDSFNTLKTHTETVESIHAVRQYIHKDIDKQLLFTFGMGGGMRGGGGMMSGGGMGMMNTSQGGIEYEDTNPSANKSSTESTVMWNIIDRATGRMNEDIYWILKKGVPIKIRVTNNRMMMAAMQHPVHFHGQQFLVTAVNGVENTNLAWKDTVTVPSGESVDILLYPTNPGEWIAHCHIAEHLTSGMTMRFRVE